jgi:hypothetical protein
MTIGEKGCVDTATAMQIVGHKSDKKWKRYNAIEESDLLNAAKKLNTYLETNTLLTPAHPMTMTSPCLSLLTGPNATHTSYTAYLLKSGERPTEESESFDRRTNQIWKRIDTMGLVFRVAIYFA